MYILLNSRLSLLNMWRLDLARQDMDSSASPFMIGREKGPSDNHKTLEAYINGAGIFFVLFPLSIFGHTRILYMLTN